MGKLEVIEEMENYVEELGYEVQKVKKASDYLKMIEDHQQDLGEAVAAINGSKEQLDKHQRNLEKKLKSFHSLQQEIDSKLEGIQQAISDIHSDTSKMVELEKELNEKIDRNRQIFKSDLNGMKVSTKEQIISMNRRNTLFFGLNIFLSVIILAILFLTQQF